MRTAKNFRLDAYTIQKMESLSKEFGCSQSDLISAAIQITQYVRNFQKSGEYDYSGPLGFMFDEIDRISN